MRLKRPILSVVIPTWNRARLVSEAIESALAQLEGAVEVIVVDDGSTDGTSELLRERFGTQINLISRAERGGIGAARNLGAREASGDLLGFLDSDDLWLTGKLEAELAVFAALPESEAVVSDCAIFFQEQPLAETRFGSCGLLAASGGEIRALRECEWVWGHWKNTLTVCCTTIRRDALSRLGEPLFCEDLTAGEDWELEMRIYNQCRVAVLPEVWCHVRRIDDGTRPNRACPGSPLTLGQQISLLGDKLRILEKTLELNGLQRAIVTELEACRRVTAAELAHCLSLEARPAVAAMSN